MKPAFADTLYWIAIFLPGDPWASAARAVDLSGASIVTTEEFLTAVSAQAERTRRLACRLVREILTDPAIEVVAQSHESFLAGLELYERRPDKDYSLTDCISMNVERHEAEGDSGNSDE